MTLCLIVGGYLLRYLLMLQSKECRQADPARQIPMVDATFDRVLPMYIG